jgi:hypothetical protein
MRKPPRVVEEGMLGEEEVVVEGVVEVMVEDGVEAEVEAVIVLSKYIVPPNSNPDSIYAEMNRIR